MIKYSAVVTLDLEPVAEHDLKMHYSSFEFRPDHVILRYKYGLNGWKADGIKAVGQRVRKDGSVSPSRGARHDNDWYTSGFGRNPDSWSHDVPDWLETLVKEHRPTLGE